MQGSPEAQKRSLHEVNEDSSIVATRQIPSENELCRKSIVKRVEDILIKSRVFSLTGKKALHNHDENFEVVMIDATKTPIERPKKKKRHTIKTQVVVDKTTRQVIAVDFSVGKTHDFNLFKKSQLLLTKFTKILTDSGYQDIQNLHDTTELPQKKKRGQKLSKEDKKKNTAIASQRAGNEHAIGFIKRFKVVCERYRHRRKRFGLRFSLIAGMCNFELAL